MSGDLDARGTIAQACRILAGKGLVDGVLGHVSARVDEDTMLIRCRGRAEQGVLFTQPTDVRRVKGGRVVDGEAWDAPKELPLHARIYAARPDVGAVVHAHPMSALLCGLSDLEPRPVFGAFNIPALRLARQGVPVYPRSVLVSHDALGDEVAAAMGRSDVCLLRGHGIVAVGPTVESALVTAVNLDVLLSVTLQLARLGATPASVPPEDLAELPDLGSQFNDELAWRALAAQFDRAAHEPGQPHRSQEVT